MTPPQTVHDVSRFVETVAAILETTGPLSPPTIGALVLAHGLSQECALVAPTKEILRASAVGSLGLAMHLHGISLATLYGIRAAAKSMGGPLS